MRKGLPWSCGIGKDVTDCKTAQEVINKAGLAWGVEKSPLMAKMSLTNYTEQPDCNDSMFIRDGYMYDYCPNAYCTYRTDINMPLGVVKSRYEIVQNSEAFTFFNDVIRNGDAQWLNAGYLGYGQKIFVTAKIPNTIKVGDDNINSYLVFSNSHDGTSSVNILFSPIRVLCTNMLNSAIKSADSYIRLRHTKNVKEKLEFGKYVLAVALDHAQSANKLYNSLFAAKMTDDQVIRYIVSLNLTEQEKATIQALDSKHALERIANRDFYLIDKANISTRKVNQIVSTVEYYMKDVSQEDIKGTAWGAYNAITGYYSNIAQMGGEKRMDSLLWGGANKAMQEAFNYAYDYANEEVMI